MTEPQAGPTVVGGLWMLLAGFSSVLVLFGVVLAFVDLGDDPAMGVGVAAVIVAAVGLVCVLAGPSVGRLDGSADEIALASYRTRFFLRLAVGEVPTLVGFALSFLAGSIVPYLVGLPFAALGYWRAAPTADRIQADVEALQAQGSRVDLRDLLNRPPG